MTNTFAPPATTYGRIDDIECLRALAVLGVVLHHTDGNLIYWGSIWHSIVPNIGGWAGVDLFFAISGFVIARTLLPALSKATADPSTGSTRRALGAFWTRRMFRLWPSAWLWLGLLLLAALFFNHSGVFGSVHANVMATLAGIANVANFRFADAFMTYEYGASFVYWTLSLEEQFYLALPLLALIFRRHLWLFLIAAIVLQASVSRTPLLMSIRTDALAWGVLIALFETTGAWKSLQPKFMRFRMVRYAVLTVLAGLFIALASAQYGSGIRLHISLIAVVCAVLVWLASYDGGYICAPGRLRRLLIWIGARSYAIYLIHIPVYMLAREVWHRIGVGSPPGPGLPTYVYVILSLMLIALLADLNYRFVEVPLRNYGKSIAKRIESAGSRAYAEASPTGA